MLLLMCSLTKQPFFSLSFIRFCQIASSFHFGFLQPPTQRTRSLYLCATVTGSLFIVFYSSQSYSGGGILTHLHTWYTDLVVLSNIDETFRTLEFSQLSIAMCWTVRV
jgi:hypothetical protein